MKVRKKTSGVKPGVAIGMGASALVVTALAMRLRHRTMATPGENVVIPEKESKPDTPEEKKTE